ncbi:MAG: S26 family signal peptidase [Planctomycetes bacterium]|nr:S26 family signal peptidase [Planctomycetota bacterium]
MTRPHTRVAHSAVDSRVRKRRRSLRNNLLAVGVTSLLVAASLFWIFAFHFYNVGSNSMAPALQARETERDRLLCWRLTYHYRKPKRWEIAIFDTPGIAADRQIAGLNTGGESGLTVKRIAGLENEQLAIAGGDIWTRPVTGQGDYVRQVKPDSVQQGMWIRVYTEDFTDRSTEEFLAAWEEHGAEPVAVRNHMLLLPPDTRLRYKPMARVGIVGQNDRLVELPGIPDRYLLHQDLLYVCKACGHNFSTTVDSYPAPARCPACRHLNQEDAVTLYTFRSGLPETGPYHVGNVLQGDMGHFRNYTYNFVADLKLETEVRLDRPDSVFRAELSGEDRVASLSLSTDQVLINDRPVANVQVKAGEWNRVEFQVVDGAVRLFLGENRTRVFDRPVWLGPKPDVNFDGGRSGVAVATAGGGVTLRRLTIDRDVFYYSGQNQGIGTYLSGMTQEGDVLVGPGQFFPLGDNSTVSLDGRSWGAVDMDLLRGTALRIWSPPDRAGPIPAP